MPVRPNRRAPTGSGRPVGWMSTRGRPVPPHALRVSSRPNSQCGRGRVETTISSSRGAREMESFSDVLEDSEEPRCLRYSGRHGIPEKSGYVE
jgi:hypothetical protein